LKRVPLAVNADTREANTGAGFACRTAPVRQGRAPSLLDRDHHVGGLDHGNDLHALCNAQIIDRLVGDRCRDDWPTDVDVDEGRCGAFDDVDNGAFEFIARADFHDWASSFSGTWLIAPGGRKFEPALRSILMRSAVCANQRTLLNGSSARDYFFIAITRIFL
jgi:hypothetical protein